MKTRRALILLILMNFLSGYLAFLDIPGVLNNEDITTKSLTQLSIQITSQYYMADSKKCVVLVSSPGHLSDFNSVNGTVFMLESEDFCQDIEAAERMAIVFEEMCATFVVKIPNPYCFFKLWLDAQWKTIQRPNVRIIFLPLHPTSTKIADEVFTLKESDYSATILAVDLSNDTDWPFYVYAGNFYERVETPNRNPKILLDQFSSDLEPKWNANLIPDFMSDLKNKSLKVMTFDYDPYTHFDPLSGTEIKLIQEFCRKHNCTLSAVDDGHFWGDIFDNGTSDGLAGMVYDGRADFGAAAVYLWLPYFYFVDYSTSYMYSASTLLVPKPHLVSPWKTPFMPFDVMTWIAYGCSVVMAAFCMYIITHFTVRYTGLAAEVRKRQMFLTKSDSFFRALGLAVLQQPNTPLVPRSPIRHLFTSFEFFFLITSSIYSAELASYLTVPRYTKPIDTLIELANSGMLWIGEHESWTYSLRGMTDPEIVTIVKNYRIYSHEKLKELAPTGAYGLIVERLPGGHYSEQQHVTDEIVSRSHMMAENLFGSPPVIAIRKASPYRAYLNKVISDVMCSGIYLFWEGEMSRLYLHSGKQLALKEADHPHYKDDPLELDISHIQGGLLLYAIGITIASIIFVVEILVHRTKQSKSKLVNLKKK